jgi:hypothetical protein
MASFDTVIRGGKVARYPTSSPARSASSAEGPLISQLPSNTASIVVTAPKRSGTPARCPCPAELFCTCEAHRLRYRVRRTILPR